MNAQNKFSAHDDFVAYAKETGALQAALEDVIASVTGAAGTLPVYENRSQFFALPFLISRPEWVNWCASSEFLVRTIYHYVSRRYAEEGDQFLLSLGVAPEQFGLLSLAGAWPRLEHTMARPDFFQGPAGPLFIEANIDSSLGGLGTADPLCRIVGRSPSVTGYMGDISESTRLIPAFASQLRCIAKRSAAQEAFVSIIDWKDEVDDVPWPYEWIARDLAREGLRVDVLTENNFQAGHGADIIYRGITPVVKLWTRMHEFDEVWKAVKAGTPMLSTLWDVVLSSKAVFGEMWRSLELNELEPEDAEFVRNHVMWTWPVSRPQCIYAGRQQNTLEFAIKMQSDLVIKSPSDGSCKNVAIGRYCTAEEWWNTLHQAAKRPGYVLQKFQEPATRWNVCGKSVAVKWMKFRCVDSVFVFGGRAAGTCVRGTTADIPYISCMHGAQEGVALVV